MEKKLDAKALLKGLVLHTYLNPDQPLATLKRQALTRRSNKLIEWLGRPSYAIYSDHGSTENLARLADLIIWALEMSLPIADWKPFLADLRQCRSILTGIPDPDDHRDEQTRYADARKLLLHTLENYKNHIATAIR